MAAQASWRGGKAARSERSNAWELPPTGTDAIPKASVNDVLFFNNGSWTE
ncbi:MAG: hypothetical protein NT163_07380 [Chlorobiales bacterium]|nr:hypothetical protein [Chlorobiales bacterium]